jgi:hypothetical protein
MKIISTIFFFYLVFIPLFISSAEIETDCPTLTVEKFIIASRNGDLELLKTLITGPYYEKRMLLLEYNEGYADFLRKNFEDIFFEINKVEFQNDPNYAIVQIKKIMHNNQFINFELILIKDNMGNWKVFDEVLD